MNTMTKPFLISLSLAFLLISCSEKKVLVMASGKITVVGNIISAEEGTTHSEQECIVKEASVVIKNTAGSSEIPVNESGLYILNIKKDTIVGSYQHLGTDNSLKRLSQEALQRSIDSLESLMKGLNVTAANRNFCIPPGKLSFITENTQAQVVGPYLKMPGSFEGGREYEIYKFYTNKEIREIIEKLRKLQG
ncbi:MAG: hypothetical protein RL732_431 [Bacteroidota bacterium]